MSQSIDTDPRVEALARHLARAAGWTGPGNDENTLVTKNLQEQVVAPGGVYSVPRGGFPVWQAYTDMAEAALEWLDAIEPEGEFRRGVAA